jgi:hypothetical protein
MGKSVLIPLPLFRQIIELLEYWNISDYDRAIRDGYCDIMRELNMKMQKLEIRDAYAKIVAATNEDDIHDARMAYLWQKSRLNDIAADGCIF